MISLLCGKFHIRSDTVECYLPSVLLLLIALPLLFEVGLLYGVAALLIGCISLFIANRVHKRLTAVPLEMTSSESRLEISPFQFSLNELSGAIAHEINNPLGIIAQETAWIEYLLRTSGLEGSREIQDCRESVQFIAQQVDRCKEIVEKLIHLARRGEPVIQLVDVNAIIKEMATIVRRNRSEKDIKLRLDLGENVPPVLSDGPMLRQIMLNLMVNAVQACGECGNILVTSRHVADSVEVTVEDNGCGIAPQDLPNVFVPFYSTKKEGECLGLGLALCRSMIEMLGGRITVSSVKGLSTRFTIYLPTAQTHDGRD